MNSSDCVELRFLKAFKNVMLIFKVRFAFRVGSDPVSAKHDGNHEVDSAILNYNTVLINCDSFRRIY